MNFKSIIVAFAVLGSTSTAVLADPSVTVRAEAQWGYSTPVVRDHRTQTPAWTVRDDRWTMYDRGSYHPVRPEPGVYVSNTKLGRYSEYVGPIWMPRGYGFSALTEPTRIDNSRQDFTIGAHNGSFNAIQLRNVAGSSFIRKVTIEFENNEAQVVQLNTNLNGRDAVTINLDGRNRGIKRIFVYGTTNRGAAYQLFAK